MGSNNSPGKRLFDILELQMEILEISLREDNFAKYVRVRNTVSQFLQSLIGISKQDFERFKRIIDLRNNEEEELFNDIKSEDKQLYHEIISGNKVIRFLLRFFLKGTLSAFETSDESKFRIFYIDLNKLFNEITSGTYVVHETRNFFGEEYSSPKLKTKFFLDESIAAYYDFISVGKAFNTDINTRQQTFIKYKILFEFHWEYYFKDDFELTLTQETLNLIERIILEQIIEKNDHATFSWICSSLYYIADERYFRWGGLREKVTDKHQTVLLELIDSARSINTIDQFLSFNDSLKEVSTSENESSITEIRKLAIFSLKSALFRYLFIRIGAKLIAKGKHEMVYELLFARQPLEVDYINSNHDFFPTEIEDVTEVLANLDKLSYTHFGRFEKKPMNKQRDQFVLLWLLRNYIWKEQQHGYKYAFGLSNIETGPEVEHLQKLLVKLHNLIDEEKNINSPLLTFEGRISEELVEKFQTAVSKIKESIISAHLEKIKSADLISDKVSEYRTKVLATLNNQKSLTNFFLRRQGQKFALSDSVSEGNIRNTQLYDKGPFIDQSLPLISSINADSVYPEVMGKNLSMESDSYLFRKIRRYCKEEYLTIRELSEKLLSSDFKNKTVLSHYIHLGFELLRSEFRRNEGTGKHEGIFTNSQGLETKVYSFYSFSQLKFVMVFGNSAMEEFIAISGVQIEQKDYPEDYLQVLFEGVFNMSIKELEGKQLGTIYYLR